MERQLTKALRRATIALRDAIRQTLGDLELTPVQNTVLHMIGDTPGSSSAELARRADVTPQTMHKLVTELHHRDLLELRPRPGHGRILDAHLTGQGRRLVADADARLQTIEDRLVTALDQRQRQQLQDLLRCCVTALDVPSSAPPRAQHRPKSTPRGSSDQPSASAAHSPR